MTTDVLKLQGNYIVQTQSNGTITLDTGGRGNTGTVIVTGNLDVRGVTTQIESVNATVKDATILLNQGDPATLGNEKVTLGLAGLQISRGNNDAAATSAYIQWNENTNWGFPAEGSVGQDYSGLFEFRVGTTFAPVRYSAIKINAIRIDESSAPVINGVPRLSIFGKENTSSVISVAGHEIGVAYASKVTDPDDIPNKYYVDHVLSQSTGTSAGMRVNTSYVKLIDYPETNNPPELLVVLGANSQNDVANDLLSHGDGVTSGIKAFSVTTSSVTFSNIQFTNNQISTTYSEDLIIAPSGASSVTVFASPIMFSAPPTQQSLNPAQDQVAIYGGAPESGGTGMFYVNNSSQNLNPVVGEFVSRKKALIYSLIF